MQQLDPKQVGRTLADMPLGAIVESIAISIADAQVALDRHAIDIFNALANDRVNLLTPQNQAISVSPLELGFAPTFYHFDTVTIEIAVEIKLHVEEMLRTTAGFSAGNYQGPGSPAAGGAQDKAGTPESGKTASADKGKTGTPEPGKTASADKTNSPDQGKAGGQNQPGTPPAKAVPPPPPPPADAVTKGLDDFVASAPPKAEPATEPAPPTGPPPKPADTSKIENILAGLDDDDAAADGGSSETTPTS